MEGFMSATFDYKDFAKDLTKQAESVIPDDIANEYKKEFLSRIYDFTYIAGKAFSKDESIENSETAKFLTQIISEWTFHKYIDLLRSDIPSMYHESILQKLGYVAYEMTREAAVGNLSKEAILELVELQLKKAYEKSCKHLLDNGQISKEAYENAVLLSNIDKMKINSSPIAPRFKTFNYTLCALGFALFTLCMNIFYYDFQYLDVLNTFALAILSGYIGFYIGVKKFAR